MQEVSAMTVSHGKPYAGNLHVRFDEGADVPDEGRLALLHHFTETRRITFMQGTEGSVPP